MTTFIDTSYILALVNTADEYQETASNIALEIRGPFITTEAVLTEIGNALARLRWRKLAISTLGDLRSDSEIEVISVTSELFDRGLKLYSSRMDKEWGITDCISFTVMEEKGIINALTTDEHFRQAGFRALLLE